MSSEVKRFIGSCERLVHLVGSASAWGLPILVLVICIEVFSRYLLGEPTTWSYDIGYMLTAAFFVLGAGLTLQKGEHIREDILYSKFKEGTKRWVNVMGYLLLGLPVVAWLSFALFNYFYSALQTGETSGLSAWNPPVWPFRFLLFFGIFILTLQLVLDLLKLFLPRVTPLEPSQQSKRY